MSKQVEELIRSLIKQLGLGLCGCSVNKKCWRCHLSEELTKVMQKFDKDVVRH